MGRSPGGVSLSKSSAIHLSQSSPLPSVQEALPSASPPHSVQKRCTEITRSPYMNSGLILLTLIPLSDGINLLTPSGLSFASCKLHTKPKEKRGRKPFSFLGIKLSFLLRDRMIQETSSFPFPRYMPI